MTNKTLIVCSITNWIAQDFIEAKLSGWEVVADKGFDLPVISPSPDVAWWMPTEHAVKLRYSGLDIPFIAPGSSWLSSIPQSLTKRSVVTETVQEVLQRDFSSFNKGKIWIKPAEFKHQDFFAGLYSKDGIAEFNLPEDAYLQWTDTVFNLTEEHRFYIVDGQVKTGSEYLVDGVTYYDGAKSARKQEALNFAVYAVDKLGRNQPPAYTLDIAYDTLTESWLILEGNPMFSSAIYGSDPKIVAECLLRCANPLAVDSKWLWIPDSFLMKKYARMRPLG